MLKFKMIKDICLNRNIQKASNTEVWINIESLKLLVIPTEMTIQPLDQMHFQKRSMNKRAESQELSLLECPQIQGKKEEAEESKSK